MGDSLNTESFCKSDGNCGEQDIEDLSSVCTEAIPFVVARSAINKAFCKSPCRPALVTKTPNGSNKRCQENSALSCDRFKGTFGDVNLQESIVGVHLTRRITKGESLNDLTSNHLYLQPLRLRPCYCWKRSFFGCSYCDSRVYWTWPGWCPDQVTGGLADLDIRHWPEIPKPERQRINPPRMNMRLVMEEAERKEEAERWRDRGQRGAGSEVMYLSRLQTPQRKVTTTAILEGARNLNSSERHALNGILPTNGEREARHQGDQADPDDKPPNLVVNLNHFDKASQVPEPLPPPQLDSDMKKADQVDGLPDAENSCLVDCLYVTLQCCDCSIM